MIGATGSALHHAMKGLAMYKDGLNTIIDVIYILVDHGIDVLAQDEDGCTAMQIARRRDYGGHLLLEALHGRIGSLEPEPYLPPLFTRANAFATTILRQNFENRPKATYFNLTVAEAEDIDHILGGKGPPSYISQTVGQRYSNTLKRARNEERLRYVKGSARYGYLKLLLYEYRTAAPFDLEEAMTAFRTTMASVYDPLDRFHAARLYADLCLQFRDAASALKPFRLVMSLLQRIVDPGLSITIRTDDHEYVRDTVSAAVAAAAQSGDAVLALEWFELGRCMIWGHISRMRPPMEKLRRLAPRIADDISKVGGEILSSEEVIEGDTQNPGREGALVRHHLLADKYSELISQARLIPGLEGFLAPKSFDELKAAASRSHIVALNVAWWRHDALVIRRGSSKVSCVPLPLVSHQRLQNMVETLCQSLNQAGVRKRSAFISSWGAMDDLEDLSSDIRQVLQETWYGVVKPVLDFLGCTGDDGTLPCVTWCTSDLLASLPLHAAGPYSTTHPPAPGALDLAIHSYIPSLTSIVDQARHSERTKAGEGSLNVLAISQPETPGLPPLPSTTTEILTLQRVVGPERVTWMEGMDAPMNAVMSSLETHDWVHFACHATQDTENPLQSSFCLYNGALSLRAIMRLRHKADGMSLAVLSACETAMGDSETPEEGFHLAAGMLMAGFQNVVGTLWSINDDDGPVIAEEFYRHLVHESGGDSGEAARALHSAVQTLRDEVGEDNFLRWIPFVHIGV
ncbi:hypothetical protein CYLTODRAFT_422135, partial [Cylindrobasidium torrendii FP15055 ss-10]